MDKTRSVWVSLGFLFVTQLLFVPRVQAGLGVSPTSLSFGTTPVGTNSPAGTVTITNTSRQSVSIWQVSSSLSEFVVTGPTMPVTIGSRGSATFQVVFRPDAAVTFNGTIVFATGRWKGNASAVVSVSGTGTTTTPTSASQSYLLSASTSSLTFGNVLVGSSTSQTVSVTNTGTGSVTVSQVTLAGSGFQVGGFSGSATLTAGQTLPLTVSFAPAATGSVTGSLSVVSNATNAPVMVALVGNGVQPQISVVPTSANFGNVTVGITNTQTVTINNPGTANLSVTQSMLSGTMFGLSGLTLPLTVGPGKSSSFSLSFSPTSASSFTGSLTLVSNTVNSPLIISLSGTGVSPVLQLKPTPSSLNFGSVATGTSATQSVSLTNSGNSSVSVSQASVGGSGFSLSGLALPLTLSPGQATSFSVVFSPTTTGSLSGNVTVSSNATNSPLTIALSGSGSSLTSHSVNLSWVPSGQTFAGFNVYRGSQPGGPYAKVNSALISATSFSDISVSSGQTYYYVATEVDSTGAESAYSTEVSAPVP